MNYLISTACFLTSIGASIYWWWDNESIKEMPRTYRYKIAFLIITVIILCLPEFINPRSIVHPFFGMLGISAIISHNYRSSTSGRVFSKFFEKDFFGLN